MGTGGKFVDLWRNHYTVISTSAFYLVLVVVEHSMDPDFKCPEGNGMIIGYSLCYIIIPPLGLFLVGLIFQPPCRSQCNNCDREKCKRCCGICLKSFVPAVLWIIIILLDGKYFDCLCKSPKVTCPARSSPPVTAYHISQFIGLVFILVIPCGGFTWWLCCNSPTERIPIEAEQSKTLLKDKAAKYLKEQRDEAIQKLIEKHLNDKYAAAPETFQIELTDDEISDKIKEGFNVARGNQPPAAGRENASGRAGSSNGRNAATPSENQTRNGQDSNQTEMQNLLDNEASSTSPEGTSSPSPQQASTV
ncbi:uncharacterized protein LOC142821193 isoform X2 [Pelodiscus sinensis]|uniref:uncharacterized protein LOC142821193 isoform X2 n=1 Tax=Pelodiscus sinensis TaxID=13735 RepID=UPI003F6DA063